jgi:hypothetical protein
MSLIGALRSWRRLDPAARRFSLVAWLLAPPVTVALEVAGFRRVRRVLHVPVARPRTGSEVDAQRGEELVARVFAHTLVSGACLPRSVVQVLTHRVLGHPAELVLGVEAARVGRSEDFEAHAWVEEPGGARRNESFERLSESVR